ncbi:MAG TPA: YtxH domain-containing protein [Thermodesulfobacteriota bacterium]|nr:YtxH domain-containing protein [Thermodesulfobacteriota bacterium]
METCKGNNFGLLKGFMVGGILGAAAGVLMAPRSGRELRADIKGKADRAVDETKRFYGDNRARFREAVDCISGRRANRSASAVESPDEMVTDA